MHYHLSAACLEGLEPSVQHQQVDWLLRHWHHIALLLQAQHGWIGKTLVRDQELSDGYSEAAENKIKRFYQLEVHSSYQALWCLLHPQFNMLKNFQHGKMVREYLQPTLAMARDLPFRFCRLPDDLDTLRLLLLWDVLRVSVDQNLDPFEEFLNRSLPLFCHDAQSQPLPPGDQTQRVANWMALEVPMNDYATFLGLSTRCLRAINQLTAAVKKSASQSLSLSLPTLLATYPLPLVLSAVEKYETLNTYFNIESCCVDDRNPKTIYDDGYLHVPTGYQILATLFANVPPDPMDFYVDVGCGLGVVLCCAALAGVRSAWGVECDATRVALALKNRDKLPLHGDRITVIHGDVANLGRQFPDQATYYYFFLPFGNPTMECFLRDLRSSLKVNARRIRIVFNAYDPDSLLFRTPWLEKLSTYTEGINLFEYDPAVHQYLLADA